MSRVGVYAIAKQEAKHAARWAAVTAEADHRLVCVDSRTSDNTETILSEAGVETWDVDWAGVLAENGVKGVDGFRFDFARDHALSLMPDNVDVCVVLDLDETLDPGWADLVRAAWDADPFDRGYLQYWPGPWVGNPGGGWYWHARIHARHGMAWRRACHEDVFAADGFGREAWVEGVHVRAAEIPPVKPRSNYLPLLQLAVDEDPDDPRMWTYLARQLAWDGADSGEVFAAVNRALSLDVWAPEGAFLCRLAAERSDDTAWLERATALFPGEPEAWHALALHRLNTQDWSDAYAAARNGLGCPAAAAHYLARADIRRWGLHDVAAVAAHHAGDTAAALTHGAAAVHANPADPRLAVNLAYYADTLTQTGSAAP